MRSERIVLGTSWGAGETMLGRPRTTSDLQTASRRKGRPRGGAIAKAAAKCHLEMHGWLFSSEAAIGRKSLNSLKSSYNR